MLKPQQVAIALTLGGDAIALAPQRRTLTLEVMVMTIVSDLVLIESKSARNHQLEQMTHERAYQVLCKAKALLVALWQGTGVTTTDEIARYYEVESSVVRHASKQYRDELVSDGWREVKGKEDLKAFYVL